MRLPTAIAIACAWACTKQQSAPAPAPAPQVMPVAVVADAAVAVTPDAAPEHEAEASTYADLLVSGDATVHEGPPAAREVAKGSGGPAAAPRGRLSMNSKDALDTTTLSVDAVLAKILSAYMSGIKRCYAAELARDPSLRGKISLTFKVNEVGRTLEPAVTAFDDGVRTCVTGLMASWRFPIPKDQAGNSTVARFKIVVNAVPD